MSQRFWYEDTIRSHPGPFFGVWTPEGWRTHKKIMASLATQELRLSGDGVSDVLLASALRHAVFEIHDLGDLTSDGGIYPAEPRVFYPPERPRWAVSHTYLAYPHADQTLYAQEYMVDDITGKLLTHFRHHVEIEEAWTDGTDGLTVKVSHRPISGVVVGQKAYPICNSAVRGVWTDAQKKGRNLYIKPQWHLCRSLNAIYIPVSKTPVVQCAGIWKAEPRDLEAFDQRGFCLRPDILMANGIPVDCPKLGSVGYRSLSAFSQFYGGEVELMDPSLVEVSADWLKLLRGCRDISFREHAVGFSAWQQWQHWKHIYGVPGHYAVHWDFNGNGIVDQEDEKVLISHIGRFVRPNYYSAAYFGNDWLSTGLLLEAEMHVQVPVICAWSQGAGYDAENGLIRLFDSPGPNEKVFVEYHYDAPAELGRDNILVSYRKMSE